MNSKQLLSLIEALIDIEQGACVIAMNNTTEMASLVAKFDDDVLSITVQKSRIWPLVKNAPKFHNET